MHALLVQYLLLVFKMENVLGFLVMILTILLCITNKVLFLFRSVHLSITDLHLMYDHNPWSKKYVISRMCVAVNLGNKSRYDMNQKLFKVCTRPVLQDSLINWQVKLQMRICLEKVGDFRKNLVDS